MLRPVTQLKSLLGLKWRELPGGTVVKNPPATVGDARDVGSISGQEDPWRRNWQPTPVFLPGKSHGQRSLVG